ncbi:MAG TPA: tail fiber protein [Longimicrobium sp.]
MIILPGESERTPEEIQAANVITRREVLRRVAFGTGAVLIPGLLAACVDDYHPLGVDEEAGPARDVSINNASESFLAEIRIVSFNFAPSGWARCNGQLLPINQNQALFALLGTTYGGNGQTNFALPNLQGRVPIHFDASHDLGESAGSTSVMLNIQQLPTHVHGVMVNSASSNSANPIGNFLGNANNMYVAPQSLTPVNPGTITSVGGSQSHNNMMPYLTLNFIIALQGIFPSRN